MSGTSGRRRAGAFIPRTLAELEAGGPGRAAILRAALIVSLLALAAVRDPDRQHRWLAGQRRGR